MLFITKETMNLHKDNVMLPTEAGDVVNKQKLTTPVLSEQTSSANNLKDLSPVAEDICLSGENHVDDNLIPTESRSQSAEPPKGGHHLSGQGDTLGPLIPPIQRRQVVLQFMRRSRRD